MDVEDFRLLVVAYMEKCVGFASCLPHEGRPGVSDVIPPSPRPESQVSHLIPLYYLLSFSSVYYRCSFCLVFLLLAGIFSLLVSRKFFNIFLFRDRLIGIALV